jgi:hypothetical protein
MITKLITSITQMIFIPKISLVTSATDALPGTVQVFAVLRNAPRKYVTFHLLLS